MDTILIANSHDIVSLIHLLFFNNLWKKSYRYYSSISLPGDHITLQRYFPTPKPLHLSSFSFLCRNSYS